VAFRITSANQPLEVPAAGMHGTLGRCAQQRHWSGHVVSSQRHRAAASASSAGSSTSSVGHTIVQTSKRSSLLLYITTSIQSNDGLPVQNKRRPNDLPISRSPRKISIIFVFAPQSLIVDVEMELPGDLSLGHRPTLPYLQSISFIYISS